jgi:predicted metalloprotease
MSVLVLLLVAVVVLPHHLAVAGRPAAAETVTGIDAASPPLAIRHVGVATATTRSDDALVAGVLSDIGTFWADTLPTAFDTPFVPLTGGYVSIDSTAATGTSFCISSPDQISGNAYYCPTGDAIVYDSAGLVPVLIGHYGVAGLTAAFAHEFGHAIQDRIGPTAADRSAHPALYPTLLIEAQGDCFSGAFLAWAVAGHTEHVRLPESSMVRAVAPLLDFGDPVDVPLGDATAHGLALDRLTDLLLGYRSGAAACHALTRAEMKPTLGRPGLIDHTGANRFTGTAAVLTAARTSVSAFLKKTLPGNGSAVEGQPLPADLSAGKPYGQFAEAATLALAVGRTATNSVDGAACFTGAWTASVFGHVPAGALGSWGSDADEALNMLRARPTADFGELQAYADGFAKGWSACSAS